MAKRMLGVVGAVAMTAIIAATASVAQAFPDRPVHFVAPYNPGGTVDPTARIMANAAAEIFGQPVVVENRSGAAGSVGTEYVVRSAPDGYTVLIHTNIVASEPCLKPNLPYEFLETMKPVVNLVETPFVVLVHPSIPADSIEELIDYVKERPGELNFGASGIGSSGHLRGEQFKVQTGTDIFYIPYQGGAETLAALAGGEIQIGFDTLPGSIGMIRDGRLKLLAVSTDERWPLVPDTPTMAESGLGRLESQWIGAFVPKDTPDDITATLADTLLEALGREEVVAQFDNLGFAVVGKGAEETLTDLEIETAMWCETIEAAGITIE